MDLFVSLSQLVKGSQRCEDLQNPHLGETLLAAFLVVGILVSYLPQHWKIIKRGTSDGLSPYWVLLGGLSSIAAIGNILTLPASRTDMSCCKTIGSGACAAALLGVAQIGVQWTCFMFIVVLYLIYFPHSQSDGHQDLSSSTASLTHTAPIKRRDQLIVGATIFISLFLVAIISIALVFSFPKHTQTWADVLGTISGVLAAIQYLPQIYHTWVLNDFKSLSILTLIIQAPGAFLFAFSLYLRVGPSGWSTWLVYLVTGALQFVLLAMAVYYWYFGRSYKNEEGDALSNGHAAPRPINAAPEPDEHTALLSGQQPERSLGQA